MKNPLIISPRHLRAMEHASFDSFDGFDDDFDPETLSDFDPETLMNFAGDDEFEEYRGKRPAKRLAQMAQVDVTIDNTRGASAINVELFNALRSNTEIYNADYAPFRPFTIENILTETGANPQNLDTTNKVYFDQSGNLIYMSNPATPDYCQISCKQVPFKVLHESTRTNALMLHKARMNFSNASQIDETLTYQKKTFLGGVIENNISPRSFVNPQQFQSLIVDVPLSLQIDAERGLKYRIGIGYSVTLNLFISRYARGNAH